MCSFVALAPFLDGAVIMLHAKRSVRSTFCMLHQFVGYSVWFVCDGQGLVQGLSLAQDQQYAAEIWHQF